MPFSLAMSEGTASLIHANAIPSWCGSQEKALKGSLSLSRPTAWERPQLLLRRVGVLSVLLHWEKKWDLKTHVGQCTPWKCVSFFSNCTKVWNAASQRQIKWPNAESFALERHYTICLNANWKSIKLHLPAHAVSDTYRSGTGRHRLSISATKMLYRNTGSSASRLSGGQSCSWESCNGSSTKYVSSAMRARKSRP